MFRTTRIDFGKWLHAFGKYKRLSLPLLLLLVGFVFGCVVFCCYGPNESVFLGRLFALDPPQSSFRGMLSALYNSCFLPILLLGGLLFCGLSACGVPFISVVPLFFGLGLGMSECYYYSTGWRGVLLTLTVVFPSALIKATALLLGTAESMRMSLLIGGVLTQKNSIGGMHSELRLFLLRFGLFVLLILAGGIVDTLLRLLVL